MSSSLPSGGEGERRGRQLFGEWMNLFRVNPQTKEEIACDLEFIPVSLSSFLFCFVVLRVFSFGDN